MSFAHVLELDSQTELLDRLELLTNFGSTLLRSMALMGMENLGWRNDTLSWVRVTKINVCYFAMRPKMTCSVASSS